MLEHLHDNYYALCGPYRCLALSKISLRVYCTQQTALRTSFKHFRVIIRKCLEWWKCSNIGRRWHWQNDKI